jgi:predicted  nucleic acid-binding Zn-ribbon protein
MASDPRAEVVRWVQEGEQLFTRTLQTLHRCRETEERADRLAIENQRLQADLGVIRVELERLRAERIDAAETLKAIAEQVTRLATVALQRLGKPVV